MADRHLNIFHAYRHGDFEDADGERLLEDNATRALIITLRSSDLLTRKFLEEFTGVDTEGPYTHDLQGTPEGESPGGRCLIVVAGQPAIPKTLKVSDKVTAKIDSLLQDRASSRRLRNDLSKLAKQAQDGDVNDENVDKQLKQLLELSGADAEGVDLGDLALPAYLHGLTLGSRPDAWIASQSSRFTAVFENKLRGGVADEQIRRHIRKSFGSRLQPKYRLREKYDTVQRNQIPVVLWSWRDVHAFFKQLRDEQPFSIDPESLFVVSQFLDYLEVLGMGEVSFSQDDFLTWENYVDRDRIRTLLGRLETLGDELAREIGAHQVKAQRVSPGYLGVNVLHDSVADKPSDRAPHLSCGLTGRVLRLYIQCESKPLAEKLVKQRDQLIPSLTEALWKARDLSGLRLQVSEKLHIVSGGSGKNAPVWTEATSVPLELCQDEDTLCSVVGQAFDALEHFLRPEVRKEKLEAAGRGISTWGVLGIEYQWNWLVLQKEGTDIAERVKAVARMLKPSYDVLLEAYRRRSPRSRQA